VRLSLSGEFTGCSRTRQAAIVARSQDEEIGATAADADSGTWMERRFRAKSGNTFNTQNSPHRWDDAVIHHAAAGAPSSDRTNPDYCVMYAET
jgi:hypothetical protein